MVCAPLGVVQYIRGGGLRIRLQKVKRNLYSLKYNICTTLFLSKCSQILFLYYWSFGEKVRETLIKTFQWIVNNRTNLFVGTFTGAFVQVDVRLFQHNVGETSADTLDGSHGEHDFTFAIDVGTENTQDVLELFWDDQRLKNNGMTYYIEDRKFEHQLSSRMRTATGRVIKFSRTVVFPGVRADPNVIIITLDGDSNG